LGKQALACDSKMFKRGVSYGILSVRLFTFHGARSPFFHPEELEQDFPYWKRLHGFWRTLPNFNPYTASSEPGQDLVADALDLIQSRGQDDDGDADGLDYVDAMPTGADDDEGDSTMKHNELVRLAFLSP
jgi:hypothetical protein